MAEFNISGRLTVKSLKKQFKEAFGATLRVYKGKQFADDDATLASIRVGDAKGGDMTIYTGGNPGDALYYFNHSASSGSYSGFWSTGYFCLLQANNIIANIEKMKEEG